MSALGTKWTELTHSKTHLPLVVLILGKHSFAARGFSRDKGKRRLRSLGR